MSSRNVNDGRVAGEANEACGSEAARDARVGDWWRTSIIEMQPGVIRYRGYPIQELIGNVSFAQMIWLMLRGELPSAGQAQLLDAALMSAVDHGPQAPSIAIARMAATCGVGLNNAMASAVNVLGDVHGGQVLAPLVRRLYTLPAGRGTAFYDFGNERRLAELRTGLRASLAALAWAAHDIERAVLEARWAFEQHIRLFGELAAAGRSG